jgi:hypothetical protein
MTLRPFVLGTLLLLGLAACSNDSKKATADSGAPATPTFTHVYTLVMRGDGCTQAQCHGALGEGGLRLGLQAVAYTNLVGVKAAGPCDRGGAGDSGSGDSGSSGAGFPGLPTPVCGCGLSGKTRVVAGDPDASLLVEKLKGAPSCGDRMPRTGDLISVEHRALVEQWIRLGAKND